MTCWNDDIPLELLKKQQLEGINSQINLIRQSGSKAASRFAAIGDSLTSLDELEKIPLITAADIADLGTDLVCVPQRDIKRIVSLRTSGTERAKRIYFTRYDQEQTVQFFAEGMAQLCSAKDKVVILMPGTSSDGITGLLSEGLSRIGAVPYNPKIGNDYETLAKECEGAHTIVAMPGTLRRLALTAPHIRPCNVLLSADYISEACVSTIERIWKCEVFVHYGMTETCYGFAVDCPYHNGMHIRNRDYCVEIIDPVTHKRLPDGAKGIVVISSLRREAMPLIRYSTGDLGVMTTEPCGCGHSLPRIERVFGRVDALKKSPNINELDDILMGFDSVLDYTANLKNGRLEIGILANYEPVGVYEALNEAYPQLELSVFNHIELLNNGTKKRILGNNPL